MTTVNRQITLASRPVGLPKVSDFQLAYSFLPSPAAGEVLVRSLYLSLDPQLRDRLSPADPEKAEPEARPLAIGEVLAGDAVAVVVKSEDPKFRAGDAVEGRLGWQEYAVARGPELRKIDPSRAPISTALGVLGPPGLTAYHGLLDVAQPRLGDTVMVTRASGPVGMLVGQLAQIRGCRVVGVVGSDAKAAWLIDELGFDDALDYKALQRESPLEQACPSGIDVYFDNAGGQIGDPVMSRLNEGARVVLCEQLPGSRRKQPEFGPRWAQRMAARKVRLQVFRVGDHAKRFSEALDQLTRWLKEGLLRYHEDVAQGIEAAPQAFIGMLQGKSQGKQLVQLTGA